MNTLDQAALDEFRARLLQRQQVLTVETRMKLAVTADERVGYDTPNATDGGDGAVLRMNTDIEVAEAARDINELRDIDAALGRLDAGTFGKCVNCGRGIPIARLRAWPAAGRCHPCQQAFEGTSRISIKSGKETSR